MTPVEARQAFARLLQTPDAELDLAEGALLIAAEEYPELRLGVYLNQIARMATDLKRRIRCQAAGSGTRDHVIPGRAGPRASSLPGC